MSDVNVWERILVELRVALEEEDFRRWFSGTAYASDSGDQITVWIASEAIRRHVLTHYQEALDRALARVRRSDAVLRFVVAGFGDDEEEEEA